MAQYSSVSTSLRMAPKRSPYGSPNIQYFQVSTAASSRVIREGDVVSFDTVAATASHRVVKAVPGAGTGTNLLETTNVVGVAVEGSTSDGSTAGIGTAAQVIGVCLAGESQEYVGYLRGDNPSVSSIVGTIRALIYDSTRQLYNIDSTNSTVALANVVITGVPEESTVGDTNGPVYFKFLPTQTAPITGAGGV